METNCLAKAAVVVAAFLAGACATSSPPLAWGKSGVSRVEYGNDVGMCSGLAVMEKTNPELNKAGGLQGKNNAVEMGKDGSAGTPQVPENRQNQEHQSAPMPTGGGFSGMASADFATRAANAQRAQEMAAQRAKSEAMKSCLAQRGYRPFKLSADQRAKLAALPKGSDAHHEYLYSLASDPAIVDKQVVVSQ
jgi:hypothetical protein